MRMRTSKLGRFLFFDVFTQLENLMFERHMMLSLQVIVYLKRKKNGDSLFSLGGGGIVTDTRLNVLAPLWHCSSTCKRPLGHN